MFLGVLDGAEKTAFYSLAYAVAVAESGISTEEQAILDAALGEMGLSHPPTPVSLEESCALVGRDAAKRVILLELLMVAMIDGDIASRELKIIETAAEILGVQADLERAKNWASAMLTVFRSGQRFIGR